LIGDLKDMLPLGRTSAAFIFKNVYCIIQTNIFSSVKEGRGGFLPTFNIGGRYGFLELEHFAAGKIQARHYE
jgi:hypothetical protein